MRRACVRARACVAGETIRCPGGRRGNGRAPEQATSRQRQRQPRSGRPLKGVIMCFQIRRPREQIRCNRKAKIVPGRTKVSGGRERRAATRQGREIVPSDTWTAARTARVGRTRFMGEITQPCSLGDPGEVDATFLRGACGHLSCVRYRSRAGDFLGSLLFVDQGRRQDCAIKMSDCRARRE